MKFIEQIERKLNRFAIPHLTYYLIGGQALFFLAITGKPELINLLVYVPELAMHGQWWRFLTVLFIPPTTSVIFIVFAFYMFYLMGSALEAQWGSLRFNLFILIAYVMTLLSAMLVPDMVATNAYIGGSVFLAFAFLYPDFVIYLFFILPVKIKWLALITWLIYGYQFITGSNMDRVLVLAATANFLLFFSGDIYRKARFGAREMKKKSAAVVEAETPFHRCTTCGITDKTDPSMEFRYCPSCKGGLGYCKNHIFNHEHVV